MTKKESPCLLISSNLSNHETKGSPYFSLQNILFLLQTKYSLINTSKLSGWYWSVAIVSVKTQGSRKNKTSRWIL